MATSKTAQEKAAAAAQEKAAAAAAQELKKDLDSIEKLVSDFYINDTSEMVLNGDLVKAGISEEAIKSGLVKEIGLDLGLIFTAEKSLEFVEGQLEGVEKPLHYSDLLEIVEGIDVKGLDGEALMSACQISLHTALEESTRYKSLLKHPPFEPILPSYNTQGELIEPTKWNVVGKWILENPDFTASSLIKAGPLGEKYHNGVFYDEVISLRRLFKKIDATNEANEKAINEGDK